MRARQIDTRQKQQRTNLLFSLERRRRRHSPPPRQRSPPTELQRSKITTLFHTCFELREIVIIIISGMSSRSSCNYIHRTHSCTQRTTTRERVSAPKGHLNLLGQFQEIFTSLWHTQFLHKYPGTTTMYLRVLVTRNHVANWVALVVAGEEGWKNCRGASA